MLIANAKEIKLTNDYNDAAYREFEKEANRDTRVGNHTWIVSQVTHDTWPSGDPRIKLLGLLTTAGNAKADLTISPPPAPDVVKAEGKNWESGKKRAIAASIAMHRTLAEVYGKSPDEIVEGDTFMVKTALTKRNPDGTGGFVRIIAFLKKDAKADGAGSDVPF